MFNFGKIARWKVDTERAEFAERADKSYCRSSCLHGQWNKIKILNDDAIWMQIII